MLVNIKSQLLQLEKENNKLRHTVEDLSDENDNLSTRIAQIENELEAIRKENVEEAKEIEYDNEQRKIMESYESLLKSKDITIRSMEDRLAKTEERVKKRMNLKSVHLDEGIVLLKNNQTLLVKEIIKNVEASLMKSTTDSNTNLPVGKISITNVLYHLNQNLFSELSKGEVISYKELHPLSNQIFSFFIENKFPSSYHPEDTTPGGGKKRNSFTDAFGKLDIDELSIAMTEESQLKL